VKEDKSEDEHEAEDRSQSEDMDSSVGGATGSDRQEEEEFVVKVYGKNEGPRREDTGEGTEEGSTRLDRLTVENLEHQQGAHKKKHSKSKKKARSFVIVSKRGK